MHNLPTLRGSNNFDSFNPSWRLSDLDKKVLARYLQFYGIGAEMIQEGEEIEIKPGMEEAARSLLSQRVQLHSS